MINEKKFYVYRWIRLDTNTPFHVGKGIARRFRNTTQRNTYFKRICASVKTKVEIILDNLSEKEAFVKEAEFIALYKKLGYCETNFTAGGRGGSSGRIIS